jgi:hypothetical protein
VAEFDFIRYALQPCIGLFGLEVYPWGIRTAFFKTFAFKRKSLVMSEKKQRRANPSKI